MKIYPIIGMVIFAISTCSVSGRVGETLDELRASHGQPLFGDVADTTGTAGVSDSSDYSRSIHQWYVGKDKLVQYIAQTNNDGFSEIEFLIQMGQDKMWQEHLSKFIEEQFIGVGKMTEYRSGEDYEINGIKGSVSKNHGLVWNDQTKILVVVDFGETKRALAKKIPALVVSDGRSKIDFEQDFSNLNIPPNVLTRVAPRYPAKLKRKKISGQTTVIFIVDELGRVFEPTIERSTNRGFNQVSLDAILKWKFSGGISKGRPVKNYMKNGLQFHSN